MCRATAPPAGEKVKPGGGIQTVQTVPGGGKYCPAGGKDDEWYV